MNIELKKDGFIIVILVVLIAVLTPGVQGALSCMSPSNKPVDWFLVMKAPNGTDYLYMDSTDPSKFTDIGKSLNDQATSPVMLTLKQIQVLNSTTFGSILWNDQPPKTINTDSHAHSKGVIGFDSTNAFTLSHSTPLFPEIVSGKINLVIQAPQQVYGQHFFCVTTSTIEANNMALAFQVDYVHVYEQNIPAALDTIFPNFSLMAKMTKAVESFKIVSFKSQAGVAMKKFAKAHTWQVPFYQNVVCSNIGVGLAVETWGNGAEGLEAPDWNFDRGNLPVISCLAVDFGNGYNWSYSKDHSQYAISLNDNFPYVCFGDINRQKSQDQRGGGTICFQNKSVFDIFKQAMVSLQTRPTTTDDNISFLPIGNHGFSLLQFLSNLINLFYQNFIKVEN